MTDQLFTGPHSTWEAETKALHLIASQQEAEVKKLRKRVQELEAALQEGDT